MNNLAAALKIGTATVSAVGQELNGMVDDLVISGRNLWTTNFTPPPRTIDAINLADIAGDGSSDIAVVIGTRTVQTGRSFELVSGLTTLADSWDTRCDVKLKEVVSEDGETLAALSYETVKQLDLKQWRLKANPKQTFVGVMIDDPNIPEEIIWRTESGQPGGFSGVGFLNYLLAIQKEAIRKQEIQQLEIQQLNATIGSMTAEIKALQSK